MTRQQRCQYLIDRGYTYNPKTGEVKNPKGKLLKRKTLGYYDIHIYVGDKSYSLKHHQFAWYVMYGECVEMIDHINQDRSDNRITNLRITNHQLNRLNSKIKGYSWDKQKNKWKSQININGKSIFLGYFPTEEEANKVYLQAREKQIRGNYI